jgi:hypothetical protein
VAQPNLSILIDTILDMLLEELPDDLRAELPKGLLAELRTELRAGLPAVLPDPRLNALMVTLRARLRDRGVSERPPKAGDAESPDEAEDLWLRATRVASKAPHIWSRFGFFLPQQRREKIFGNFIADHTSDLFEALVGAGSRSEQNRLIFDFTIAVIAMVFGCAGFALQRRLCDEFDWVARRLPRE